MFNTKNYLDSLDLIRLVFWDWHDVHNVLREYSGRVEQKIMISTSLKRIIKSCNRVIELLNDESNEELS